MYTLIDGVDFYDKNEVDDMVKSLAGGVLPDDIGKDLDTRLAAEEAARIQADTDLALAGANLENRITTEEAARAQVDSALNDKIVAEASTRSNSDLMLANQIAAVEQLFTTLIGPNGFIDTDNDTVKVNDSGKSIRQIAHEEFYRQLITDADDIKQQLDTLKELADYLQDNPTVLADMYAKLGISWSLDNPTDFGSFDFSRVLTADNVDDAVLELYNTFTNMIGDLTQLTTAFKDNVVGAINEVDNNVKTKKYVDVYSINFKLDSLANPIVLKDGINHFMLAPTMAYDDVYNVLSKDTKAAVAICDIDVDNKLYAHVDSITETCITFCGTNCITTVPDDGSPVFNTYRDITINWHNDGTAEMLLSKDYLSSRIDTEETTRTQADSDLSDRITAEEEARTQADSDLENKANELDAKIGDLTTLNTVEKGAIVGAINSEFEWRRKNDEAIEERLTDLITAEIAAVEQTCSDLDAAIKNESRVRANEDTDITTSIGDMTALNTTNKVTLVGAINEVKALAEAAGGGGGGGGTGADTAQLEAKLNSEITAREQGDEQLGTRIDTEEAARIQADTDLGNRIGSLDALKTTDKSSTVSAINELYDTVQQGGGDTGNTVDYYAIEIEANFDGIKPNEPLRFEGDLDPDVANGITEAVAAGKALMLKIVDSSADDISPSTTIVITNYSYNDTGIYSFAMNNATINGNQIIVIDYSATIRPDIGDYYGYATLSNVTVPEGGGGGSGDTTPEPYAFDITIRGEDMSQNASTVQATMSPEQRAIASALYAAHKPVFCRLTITLSDSIIAILIMHPNVDMANPPDGDPYNGYGYQWLDVQAGGAQDNGYVSSVNKYNVIADFDTGACTVTNKATAMRAPSSGDTGNTTTNCEQFTFVVDSNEALANWANNVTTAGQDYTSVLIRKGEWTSTVGVNLTTAGTKVVVGEAGSKLVFNNVERGLYYDIVPKTADYYMQGVNVATTHAADGIGFYMCTNLTNCTGTVTATASSTGFSSCTNLTNCTGIVTTTTTDSAAAIGFYRCTNLTNCTGTATATATATDVSSGYGFYRCTNLTNCTGTGTGTGTGTSTSYGYGFNSCNCVIRCKAEKHCTTAVFENSYASASNTDTYVCADTANGGFNNTTNPAA